MTCRSLCHQYTVVLSSKHWAELLIDSGSRGELPSSINTGACYTFIISVARSEFQGVKAA
jgi:hypothetical protein